MKSTLFDPEKSFLHLKIVWGIVGCLLMTSIVISIIIINNTPLDLDLSSNGFNYFISVFRFPLGVLTLIIPIVALLAANHRSEQTKEQIIITGVQNNFANYYKHLEEFIKYADKEKTFLYQDDSRYIHKMLYPNAHSGDYAICENLFIMWNSANSLMSRILNNYPLDYTHGIRAGDLDEYIYIITQMSSYLRQGTSDEQENLKKGACLESGSEDKCSFRGSYLSQSIELIKSLESVTSAIDKLCHFSVEYSSLLNIDISNNFKVSDYIVHIDEEYDELFADLSEYKPQTFEESNLKFKTFLKEIESFSKAA